MLDLFEREYGRRSPLFGATPTQVVVRLRGLLGKKARIVDLGCGDGRDSLYLLSAGFRVVAIDLAKNAIAALKKSASERGWAGRLEAHVMDVGEWLPSAGSCDAVIAITLLDHLDAKSLVRVLDRIKTAVKDGGFVALEMHSDRDPARDLQRAKGSEFAVAICSVAAGHSLVRPFLKGWRVLEYTDRLELDGDHGEPHEHGFCTVLARRESVV